jgi:protein-tyrosine phosphatase
MIDIHSHILPGLDDGPATLDGSLALASAAANAGTHIIVATPHIRGDHRFSPAAIAPATASLNEALEERGIPLLVLCGGELSISRAAELNTDTLRSLTLGESPSILVESPYTHLGSLLETTLFDLQVMGFRPVLAHPERSPSFQRDPRRLADLVRKGILCSITADSLTGRFGKSVRKFTLEMIRSGLVHNIASDAHDARGRRPDMGPALRELSSEFSRIAGYGAWLTEQVPAALLEGSSPPIRPRALPRRHGLLRGMGAAAPAKS